MNPYDIKKISNTKIVDEYNKLNDYQKKAILNDDKTLLLNACVGSGKTTVLIQKILYLHLIKEVPLEEMVVLTFTNKAANEILERFINFNIPLTQSNLYFGTFHSIAKKLLDSSLNLNEIGYKNNFSIIDTDEYTEFLENIIEENNLNIKYKNKLKKRIDLSRQNKFTYGAMKYNDDFELLLKLSYEKRKEYNLMTFDDLIENCLFLLKEYRLDKEIKYVIVDEFQDCNIEQIEMIKLLLKTTGSLFAVGDPNQTIYTWRGSKLNIFEEFEKYRKFTSLTLPINYRSTSTILDIARIFLHDSSELKSSRENGNLIKVSNHYNDFNEAFYITEKIKELVSKDISYKDICILYRKQNQSSPFIESFIKENIPYEVSLRKSIKNIPVLFWFIKLLKASINDYDKFSFINVLSNENYGLNLSKESCLGLIKNNFKDSNIHLVEKILNYKINKPNIDELFDYFNLHIYLKPTSSSYEDDKLYINTFLNNLKTFININGFAEFQGIKEYINTSALFGSQIIDEKINIDNDSVKLMTLHSAKGLEFSYVFIVGANEGLIPMRSSSYEEFEEEKRLFFVGITRAKNNLEISYNTSPSGYGVFGEKSRFIDMIPSHLKNNSFENTNIETSIKDMVREIKKESNIFDIIKEDNIKTFVVHHHYGNGHILLIEDGIIKVLFEKYGEKEFIEGLEDYKIISKIEEKDLTVEFEDENIKDDFLFSLDKSNEKIKELIRTLKDSKYDKKYFDKPKPEFNNEDHEKIIKKIKELFPEITEKEIKYLDSRKKYKALKLLHLEYWDLLEKWEREREDFVKNEVKNYNKFEEEREEKILELENKILNMP